MNKDDFTYNYYFEKYKENTTLVHQRFKRTFQKENPKANIDLDKLIIDIERYQIKKYGYIKRSDYFIEIPLRCVVSRKQRYRKHLEYMKFGTIKERKERKMNKKIGDNDGK